jgi:hypothetical protein
VVSVSVCRTAHHLPAIPDRSGKILENRDGVVPVDAGIGDADALPQSSGAFGRHLLVALVDVGLDHHTDDGSLALAKLVGDDLGNLGLVAMVLIRVAYVR